MRALRLALAIGLSATVALGGYAAYPGNGAVVLALRQTGLLGRELDPQLDALLTAMIASAAIDPEGKVSFNRPLGDQRFLEPHSGSYWQVSGTGQDDFRSRSLWDRRLRLRGRHAGTEPYTSEQFADEPLRIVERTIRLPGSDAEWQFAVARAFDDMD